MDFCDKYWRRYIDEVMKGGFNVVALIHMIKLRADTIKKKDKFKTKQSSVMDLINSKWEVNSTGICRPNKRATIQRDLEKMVYAKHYGPSVVIDMQWELHLREAREAMKQVATLMAFNMSSKYPFNLKIANIKKDGVVSDLVTSSGDNIFRDSFYSKHTSTYSHESYLDMFPREKLVILSPNSKVDLIRYNPDDVYVIGGIVDIMENKPHTLTTARQHGIRHARIPMELYIG